MLLLGPRRGKNPLSLSLFALARHSTNAARSPTLLGTRIARRISHRSMLFFPSTVHIYIYMCEGGSNFDLFFVLFFFPSLFLTRYRRVWRMVVRVDRKGRQPTGGVSAASHHHGPVSEYDNPIGRCSPRYRRSSIPYFIHRSLSIPPFDLLFFFSFRRRGREREILSSSIIFQTCFVSKRRPFPTCCCRCYCCYYYRSREKIITRLGSRKFLIALSGSRSTYSALFARRDF